jgi:two-component system sensor histidine kinase AlgZ
VAVAWHILVAFLFACAARPAMNASLAIAFSFEPMTAEQLAKWQYETEMMASPFYWLVSNGALWARATTEFFFVYWFGLALVVGLRFYIDLRDQKLAASRLREDWLKARLDSLAGQLNPHFLFNSLNTVSSFVRGDPDRAETILADLSQLLRTSLRERTRPLVPVADEIEFIERYLAIEGTRFEDRLKVELEADAEALNARIPSLLLQPLVENAIKHGVSRSRGPASLTVRIGRDGEELKVVIENSFRAGEQGPGNGNGSGESVGLSNVRERLDTLYAARHRFHSGPQGDSWRVEIGLPFEQDAGRA